MDSYSTSEVAFPVIDRHECPRNCGWFRGYTKSDKWLHEWIDHPLYGPIEQVMLLSLEIKEHDCMETRNSRIRLARRRRENGTAEAGRSGTPSSTESEG